MADGAGADRGVNGLRGGRGQHARHELDTLNPPRRGWLPAAPPAPWLVRAVGSVVDWAVVALGAALVVLVFANVVARVINLDSAFVIELGELLMVWVTFLGGAAAARRNAHMSITEVIDKLGEGSRRWADLAIQSVCLTMLLVLLYYGVSLMQASWGNVLTVLQIPMAWQYMALPVGAGAMLLFVGWDTWLTWRGVPRAERYRLV